MKKILIIEVSQFLIQKNDNINSDKKNNNNLNSNILINEN